MKTNRLARRGITALLAVFMLLCLCAPAAAAEGTVKISDLDGLAAFAKSCASDSYSKDLKVILTADIDAGGQKISIPVFYGSFDGGGHRIYGLSLDGSVSDYGLFSRIEFGAEVKNLTVEGQVTPTGSQSAVGGIAGRNSGVIENCTFAGVVMGEASVGGIAGVNEAGGEIRGCTASGVARGTQYTGGIAGYNSGSIIRCTGDVSVNTTVSEKDIASAALENLESTLYGILKREETTENAVTTDTGGIAGYSCGVIQSCVNTGDVGYPHVGYNVGGIAGRQNGYMASCTNSGFVQGRKDVGGVVGQMAPDVTLQFSSDGLDELQGELNALQSLINNALDDTQSLSDTVTGRISRISGYAGQARDSANALTGQLGDFVDDNISAVNDMALLIERYLDKAVPIMDDLSQSAASCAEAIEAVRAMIDGLDGLEESDLLLAQLQSFCGEIQGACDDLAGAIDALENAFSLISQDPAVPDTSKLRADIEALRSAASDLESDISRARDELEISGSVTPGTAAQLKADLNRVLELTKSVIRDASDVVTGTDFGALRDTNIETLRKTAEYIKEAMERFSSAASHFGSAMGYFGDAMGTLRDINAQLGDALDGLDGVLKPAGEACAALSSAFSKAAQWARDLAGEEPVSFSPLGPEFDSSSDALNASLTGIGNELSSLNSELASSNSTLISDVRAINNQFMKVMNLFLNVLNSTQNVDYTDMYEDVSEKSLKSAVRGKLLECVNHGAVSADRNAGGIAGAMAIEYDTDPEDDLLTAENRSLRFTYQTKAILLDCKNYGEVSAKKSCAGGVAGRMDLGTISGCTGFGNVTSESGDYVGGIAGLSISSIRRSYAKCTLSGDKYVGGIAGSGKNISDSAAMVDIAECSQLFGSIAGEITGDYTGNVFVSDSIAGVDRVSYSGKAEQISYDDLVKLENIPEEFSRLSLVFTADEGELKKVFFNYGESFGADVYPDVPEKDGYYVKWDRDSLDNLRFDTVVSAVYEPYVTTLPSAEKEHGHDKILAEGLFREGDRLLEVRQDVQDEELPGELLGAWQLNIPDDGQETHLVRVLVSDASEKNTAVYVKNGGKWEKAESRLNGSYVCFEYGGGEVFAVCRTDSAMWWIWVIAAVLCAAAIAVCVVVIVRRRKKCPAKAEKPGK